MAKSSQANIEHEGREDGRERSWAVNKGRSGAEERGPWLVDLTLPLGAYSIHGSPAAMETPLVSSELCVQHCFSTCEVQELWCNDQTCSIGKGASETVERVDKAIGPDPMNEKLAEWVDLEKINTLVIGMGGTGKKSNVGASTILEVSLTASKAEAAVTFWSH